MFRVDRLMDNVTIHLRLTGGSWIFQSGEAGAAAVIYECPEGIAVEGQLDSLMSNDMSLACLSFWL